MMNRISSIVRWTIIPAFVLVVLCATASQRASAEQATGDTMNSMTLMLPAVDGSAAEMLSVTVRMPSSMMSGVQPQVRTIQGVGYEIDYGGPSILIERVTD